MKKSLYQQNVERSIERNVKWSDFQLEEEKVEFLDKIIKFCEKLKTRKLKKSQKTRHG
jgi:hypothetical protein